MAITYTLSIYNKYKPIDASPSGLLEILIMFLSPFKRNISFSVQETDTISPDPSKPAIVACPKTNKIKQKITKPGNSNSSEHMSKGRNPGESDGKALCDHNFMELHRVIQSKVR